MTLNDTREDLLNGVGLSKASKLVDKKVTK